MKGRIEKSTRRTTGDLHTDGRGAPKAAEFQLHLFPKHRASYPPGQRQSGVHSIVYQCTIGRDRGVAETPSYVRERVPPGCECGLQPPSTV